MKNPTCISGVGIPAICWSGLWSWKSLDPPRPHISVAGAVWWRTEPSRGLLLQRGVGSEMTGAGKGLSFITSWDQRNKRCLLPRNAHIHTNILDQKHHKNCSLACSSPPDGGGDGWRRIMNRIFPRLYAHRCPVSRAAPSQPASLPPLNCSCPNLESITEFLHQWSLSLVPDCLLCSSCFQVDYRLAGLPKY